MKELRSERTDRLFETILRLESVDECYAFFEDLCTVRELHDMAQRLEVAELLSRGRNYAEVGEATGVSSATITRVKKCLDYGEGYRLALERGERKP